MSTTSTNASTAAADATPATDATEAPTATASGTSTPAKGKAKAAKADATERRSQPVTLVQGSYNLPAGSVVNVTPTMAEQFKAQGLAR